MVDWLAVQLHAGNMQLHLKCVDKTAYSPQTFLLGQHTFGPNVSAPSWQNRPHVTACRVLNHGRQCTLPSSCSRSSLQGMGRLLLHGRGGRTSRQAWL